MVNLRKRLQRRFRRSWWNHINHVMRSASMQCRSCFGAHRIFAGAHVVAWYADGYGKSLQRQFQLKPNEGGSTISLNEEATQPTVEKLTAPCPNRRSKSTDTAWSWIAESDLDRLIHEEAKSSQKSMWQLNQQTRKHQLKDPEQEEN